MLKISRKVEYALIALRHFQNENPHKFTSAREVALKYSIPQELLAKVLQSLAKNNILKAIKGPSGGYKLATDPKEINMTEFFEIIEGPVGIMNCYFESGCDQINRCNIKTPINNINDAIRDMFNNMTLADIA